jgi:hypothetical protein
MICLVALLFTLGGCEKWLDVNTDPATPQVAKAEYLLSPIIFQMANNTATDYRVIFKYSQNMFSQETTAAVIDWDKHGYVPANDLGGSLWRMAYVNFGLNLEDMIKDGEENNKWSYAAIGYAIKAWGYQMLTDAHGPVILDEAFLPNRISFKYQDQPEVYAQVRKWCQKALVYLEKTDGINYSATLAGPSGDTMYKGDKAKWRKFIYGILAQQFSHLVNKPQFATVYADSVIKYTDLSFSSAADDATISFNGVTTADSNPFSQNFGLITGTAYGRPGQPVIDLLTGGVRGTPATNPTSSVDPRLSRMLNPVATTGIYMGVQPTLGDAATIKTIPHVLGSVAGTSVTPFPGKYIFANAAKYPIMSYSQLQFAKAEAQFLKGDKTGAQTSYINGIRGHMDFVNLYGLNGTPAASSITPAQVTAYLASSEVSPNAASLTLADIMGQKYIAQWGWAGMEQWSDLRKHHYNPAIFRTFKQLEPSQFYATNNGKYAYRLRPRYNSEYVWNKNELAKWGGLMADYHVQETWFSLP